MCVWVLYFAEMPVCVCVVSVCIYIHPSAYLFVCLMLCFSLLVSVNMSCIGACLLACWFVCLLNVDVANEYIGELQQSYIYLYIGSSSFVKIMMRECCVVSTRRFALIFFIQSKKEDERTKKKTRRNRTERMKRIEENERR